MAERGDFARGAIGRFLNHVTGVSLRPLPIYLVPTRRFIQTLPPIMICLTTKISFHRLDHITRISVHTHTTRFLESLEAERGRGNLSLLISSVTKVISKCAPKSLVTKQRHRRRARRLAAITET